MMKDHRIYPRNQSPWEPHRRPTAWQLLTLTRSSTLEKRWWMECWWMRSGRVLQHSIVLNILLSDYSFNPRLYKTLLVISISKMLFLENLLQTTWSGLLLVPNSPQEKCTEPKCTHTSNKAHDFFPYRGLCRFSCKASWKREQEMQVYV